MSAIYVNVATPARAVPQSRDPATAGKFSNQHKAARNSYPGEGGGPLSNEQKAAICIRAKEAFERIHGQSAIRNPQSAIDQWRRDEQQTVTGRPSLTLCTQGDYLPLLAHFEDLRGEPGRAVRAHVKSAASAHSLAMYKLAEVAAQRGLTLAYAEAICVAKFKRPLAEVEAKKVWQIHFDLKSRGGKGKVKRKGAETQRPEKKAPEAARF